MAFVIENNNELKRYAKAVFKELRKPAEMTALSKFEGWRRVKHVIDAPSFMDKDDAPPLQLADTCALLPRRYFAGRPDVWQYVMKLLPSMLYAFDQEKLLALEQKIAADKQSNTPAD